MSRGPVAPQPRTTGDAERPAATLADTRRMRGHSGPSQSSGYG